MINARTLAYQILLHLDRKASHPDRLIRAVLDRHSRLEDRDRALLTELVYGVLRWQGRLDWHIDQLSKTKAAKIAPSVRILLRLALYQILLLDRIPPYAAVNETVEMAKASQPAYLVRFVNGLLRQAIRQGSSWNWPSVEGSPEEYLAVTTSHPVWFIRKCIQELGYDDTVQLCQANNTVAPMVLRVNPLKASISQVIQGLKDAGHDAEPSPYLPDAARVSGLRQDITKTALYEAGWVQVQDEASQLVSHLVAPRPGERVLDLCAGFGGKSTHMAAFMRNEGEVLAVDKSEWKLDELLHNARRQSIQIIKTMPADLLEMDPGHFGAFDRVLLDAPCSGFGSLRRNPDIRWRRQPKDPYRFGQLQKSLLDHASRFVKEGGVLVYATCTLFSDENEQVAEHFIQGHPEWSLESAADFLPESCKSMTRGLYYRSLPHRHGVDGFFGARWRKER